MMNNICENKMCVICEDKSGRQFTCNGCQQSFCWKHITDHQRYIEKQMDTLVQNHYILQEQWNNPCYYDQLIQKIYQWEKESIEKIQMAANTARAELQSFIEQSKENLETSIKRISEQINQSKQLNNYSEIDINQWKQQLNNIRSQIQKSFYIDIKEDEQKSPISLIKIKQNMECLLDENGQLVKRIKIEMIDNVSNNDERFNQVFGEALLQEQNLVAIHGPHSRSFISGANLYSTGKHYLHIKIEQIQKTASSCFFGIMTSSERMRDHLAKMKSVYGVWSNGHDVKCGQTSGIDTIKRWNETDCVTLLFDCDNKQLHIENKRINWYQILNIDIDVCPFPWKFLTIMKGCRLRINNHPEI